MSISAIELILPPNLRFGNLNEDNKTCRPFVQTTLRIEYFPVKSELYMCEIDYKLIFAIRYRFLRINCSSFRRAIIGPARGSHCRKNM